MGRSTEQTQSLFYQIGMADGPMQRVTNPKPPLPKHCREPFLGLSIVIYWPQSTDGFWDPGVPIKALLSRLVYGCRFYMWGSQIEFSFSQWLVSLGKIDKIYYNSAMTLLKKKKKRCQLTVMKSIATKNLLPSEVFGKQNIQSSRKIAK